MVNIEEGGGSGGISLKVINKNLETNCRKETILFLLNSFKLGMNFYFLNKKNYLIRKLP